MAASAGSEHLFVYGTLRRAIAAGPYPELNRHARYLGTASVAGRLYDLGRYPGLVPSDDPADRVYGEIFRLRRAAHVLALLDDYEGCSARFAIPHEYLRASLGATLASGAEQSAWVYLLNQQPAAATRVPGGDYLTYLKKPSRGRAKQR